MKLSDALKQEINGMSYHAMLSRWRHSPVGDLLFQGESGDYFEKVMAEKKAALSHDEQVRTSKEIGW